MRFWLERSRHRTRWLLTVTAVGCALGAVQAPPGIATMLYLGAAIFAVVALIAWRYERQAYALISARAMMEEDAWRRYIEATPAPSWIDPDAWWELVEPDFWLVAEQQLLVGDWTIDKYLDQEWRATDYTEVTQFVAIDTAARETALRRPDFVAGPAPLPPVRRLPAMEDDQPWPRCCDAPTLVVAGYHVDGRRFGDREPPFDVLESFGFECATCGGRYAPGLPVN